MADLYIPQNPAVLRAPGPTKPPAEQAKEAVQTATFASEVEAATAFQKHLDKGYQGMVEVFQNLPPEVQAVAGDPGAFSDSEEKRLDWYFRVNEQMTKAQAMSQAQAGDFAGADATATAGPMSKQGRQDTQDFATGRRADKADADLQGLVKQGPAAAAGKSVPALGDISPKSQLGRTMRIVTGRLQPHAQTITAAAQKAGVPESLVRAIITQESRGNVNAKSPAGAFGLMQLIPSTAKDLGVDSADVAQNIDGGTRYIAQMLKKYGDVEKALAAYNAGPSRVDGLIEKHGDAWKDFLPAETKDYVPTVMEYFQAHGGGDLPAGAAAAPGQADVVKQFIEANPDILERPGGKALLDAMRADALAGKWANTDAGKDARQDKALTQQERQFVERRKTQLSKAIQQAELPTITQSFIDLDGILAPLGGFQNVMAKLPGTEFVERSLNPLLKGGSANEIKSILETIYAMELKRVSGVAVSDQEYNRYKDRFANDKSLFGGFTAADQMKALNAYLRAFHRVVDSYRLGYKGQAWDEVGGELGLDDLPVPHGVGGTEYESPQPGKPPAAGAPATGKPKVGDKKKNTSGDPMIYTDKGWRPE